MRNISFDGERIQGDDVYFEDEFDAGALVSLSGTTAISQLLYEVPQGTYSSIRIDFDAESSASQNITVLGSYVNSSSVELPVIIELDMLEFSDGLARSVAGITEIELVEDIPATATILFDPAFWFETISHKAPEFLWSSIDSQLNESSATSIDHKVKTSFEGVNTSAPDHFCAIPSKRFFSIST